MYADKQGFYLGCHDMTEVNRPMTRRAVVLKRFNVKDPQINWHLLGRVTADPPGPGTWAKNFVAPVVIPKYFNLKDP